jgi:folate-dependent phosphoribosylglycinamide formyltransferase PurN
MSAVTFDTLKFVDHLRGAGVPEAQAKAMSDAQKELFTEIFDQKELATKTDIKELKIAEVKAELIRWVVGAGFLQTALIAALLMKLIK